MYSRITIVLVFLLAFLSCSTDESSSNLSETIEEVAEEEVEGAGFASRILMDWNEGFTLSSILYFDDEGRYYLRENSNNDSYVELMWDGSLLTEVRQYLSGNSNSGNDYHGYDSTGRQTSFLQVSETNERETQVEVEYSANQAAAEWTLFDQDEVSYVGTIISELDDFGNLLSLELPNGSSWSYEYNDNGDVSSAMRTYENGQYVTYEWEYSDEPNLLRDITMPEDLVIERANHLIISKSQGWLDSPINYGYLRFSKKLPSRYVTINSLGNHYREYTFSYEYDDDSRLKVIRCQNTTSGNVTTYTIEY